MSNYENYAEAARHYDGTRGIPVGVEIITGCLAQGGTPLAQQYLLDAGCGTGNYSMALLPQVGRISAVDMNDSMLGYARDKLADECARGRIDFHRASIDSLPFADSVFDGIIVNQVLHHLELAAEAGYPVYRKVFAEFARVLKPGGGVVVNTCSHQQLRHGFWYYRLIPAETERMCERHAPPRGIAVNHGGRRHSLPAVLRAGGCADAGRRLLHPARSAGKILARWRFDLEHGAGQNHRCGLRTGESTGAIGRVGKLPAGKRRKTRIHRPVFLFIRAR